MVRVLFFLFLLAPHPVHVSLLSIDYSAEREVFDMFVRVYFDDFLIDSRIKSSDQKNLNFSDINPITKEVIINYVNDKIEIHLDDKKVSPELEKINLSDNELRMNLFFNSISKVKTIRVKNLIMTSIYNDQANMTIVRMNDFEEGAKLTPEETERMFIVN